MRYSIDQGYSYEYRIEKCLVTLMQIICLRICLEEIRQRASHATGSSISVSPKCL
jgi:hypothetical protein